MSSLNDWITQELPPAIMDDAARWMAILDSERCNEADRLAFARWLEEDLQHRWAFQELSEIWARLRTLTDVKPLLDQPKVHRLATARPVACVPAGDTGRPRRDWATLVAGLLVVFGLVANALTTTPVQRFRTGTGEIRDVTLADGSKVELNARTTMDVEMDREGRRVTLDEGEAVFHVARDRRPLVVSTRRGSVTSTDDSFAVEQDHGAMGVSALDGQVTVTVKTADLPLTEYDGRVDFRPHPGTAVVSAGERLDISASGPRLDTMTPATLARDLSWRNGYVTFEDVPLPTVVGDMRRYAAINIHLADARLDDIRVSGRFPIGDVSTLLAQLERQDGVAVDRAGPRWVILRSKPVTRLD